MIEAGAEAVLSVTPYYNKPNRRGIVRHFRGRARGRRHAGDPLQHPGPDGVNMPPDLLAELAQIDGIEAVKQANCDELQPIDGLACSPATTTSTLRASTWAERAIICVASHVAGPRCAGCSTSPSARGDRRLAARRLRDAVHHRQPDRRSRPR